MSASSGYGGGGSTPVGPVVETLTGNVGGPVGPTGNNINIIGAGGVLVTGNPGTSTLTITVANDATLFTEDTGTAAPLAGNLNIFGGASTAGINMHTHGDGANTVTVILNDSLLFPNTNGSGTQGVLFWGGNRFLHNYGTDNTFLGSLAGNLTLNAVTANKNVGIGTNSLQALTTGNENTALGYNALNALTTGIGNIAIGEGSGISYTGAETDNILIANNGVLGESDTIRIGDTGIHTDAYVSGIFGSTIGATNGVVLVDNNDKLASSTGNNGQLLIGATGGSPAWANLTSVGASIVITNGANTINLEATGTGAGASAFPTDSGTANEAAGVLNIFSGATSAFNNMNTTGAGNTVRVRLNDAIMLPATTSINAGVYGIGGDRFVHSFGAPSNTFVGLDAGNFTMAGIASANTGVGQESLLSLTDGTENTAIGFRTLEDLTNGSFNTACGYEALKSITTGSINIAIGAQSAATYVAGESNNIVIGNIGVVADANVIRIGTDGSGVGEQDACYIAGIYNRNIGPTNAPVFIDSSGKLGTMEAGTSLAGSSFMAAVTDTEVFPSGVGDFQVGALKPMLIVWDNFSSLTPGNGTGTPATFTAPIDGYYEFEAGFEVSVTSSGGSFIARMFVNGANYMAIDMPLFSGSGGTRFMTNRIHGLALLSIGDTVTFGVHINASFANPPGGFIGPINPPGNYITYISGKLLKTTP